MIFGVSGRSPILGDLRRVAGDVDFADAVVAENGAVLSFPPSGRTLTLHGPIDPGFATELRARGVAAIEGECVVEADAGAAPVALDVLRRLELPLSLAFNRQRLMVLPQAVSKATGLRAVLATLRLSAHNTLAIGDAENDHELLLACEGGVAVRWGSAALLRVADIVLEGNGPAVVPGFLRSLIARVQLPSANGRRRVLLGQISGGRPLTLAVYDRNVLITGDPRSGKSWVAGLLTEQLMLDHYCVCVVDPEGDYRTLEGLPGVRVIGEDTPPTPAEIERAFRFPDIRFRVAPRLTAHVRHRHKYADLPVPRWQSFVFSNAPGQPAALSLAGFATILSHLDLAHVASHLRHRDFSRWLADVFGDRTLARAVSDVEDTFAVGKTADAAGAIVAAIKARYDVKGDHAA